MRATRCLVLAALAALVACASESSCPAEKPSGDCDTADLRCNYSDEQGCPHAYVCRVYSSYRTAWTEYKPPPGLPCTSPGQVCEYSLENDTPHTAVSQDYAFECGPSGTWKGKSLCPEQQPTAGSPCEYELLLCGYDCPGGTGQRIARCELEVSYYTWTIDEFSCAKAGG
ncbi:MAG TPA: hypothetical protein VM694_39185 [Polyangium sp.]|nr:hypothetical protein [Polyangium sp.]